MPWLLRHVTELSLISESVFTIWFEARLRFALRLVLPKQLARTRQCDPNKPFSAPNPSLNCPVGRGPRPIRHREWLLVNNIVHASCIGCSGLSHNRTKIGWLTGPSRLAAEGCPNPGQIRPRLGAALATRVRGYVLRNSDGPYAPKPRLVSTWQIICSARESSVGSVVLLEPDLGIPEQPY